MKARAYSIASAIVVAGLALFVAPANADISANVLKAFKGQIIVSQGPLLDADSDKATIAAYKAQQLKVVTGAENDDDVTAWHFHYTAFLKKKGFTTLTLQFHAGDAYLADQQLNGVDRSATVIEGDISLSEDDGLKKNKDYTLKLVSDTDVVVAVTTLRLE